MNLVIIQIQFNNKRNWTIPRQFFTEIKQPLTVTACVVQVISYPANSTQLMARNRRIVLL